MSTTCLTGITLTVQRVLHGFKDHLKVLNSSFTSTHRDVLSISICFTDPTEHNVQIIDIIRPNLIHHFQENRCQRRLGSQVQTIFLKKGTMACIWPSVMKKLMLLSLSSLTIRQTRLNSPCAVWWHRCICTPSSFLFCWEYPWMIPTNRTRAAINIAAQGYYSTHCLTQCSYGLRHGEPSENKSP